MKHICKQCKKEFNHPSKKRIFCSNPCYHESRIGVKLPHYGKKVSDGLKLYYTTEKYKTEDREKRNKKIAESNIVKLDEKEIILLWEFLRKKYVRNLTILIKHISNRNISHKAILNYFKNYPDAKILWEQSIKYLEKHVQKLSIDEWEDLKKLIKEREFDLVGVKYKVFYKTIERIKKFFPESKPINRRGKFSGKETNIKQFIRLILEDNKIPFIREYYINNNKWIVDFFIKDKLMIEIQGDYWHGNPLVFKEEKLNKIQLKNKLNDINKKNWIIENGYLFEEIWEKDINETPKKVKEKLLNLCEQIT